jgi:hypothetical protein
MGGTGARLPMAPRKGLLECGCLPAQWSSEEPTSSPLTSAAIQGWAFCFQVPDPLPLSGRGAGSFFPALRGYGPGSREQPPFHWRTFTDKFSRAGEIVEIMRGTLPLAARTGCTLCCTPALQIHFGPCNGRPGPQRPTSNKTDHHYLRPRSCPSTRGDAIGRPICLDYCAIHRRLSKT